MKADEVPADKAKRILEWYIWDGEIGDSPVRELTNKIVKSRKSHECRLCEGPIEPGDIVRVSRAVMGWSKRDAEFMTWRCCPACCEAMGMADREMASEALLKQFRKGGPYEA